MEEMDDDFGDLYADVEVQVSTAINAISSFNRLYIEPDKNGRSSVKELLDSDSSLKKVDSISPELLLCNKDERTSPEGQKPSVDGLKTTGLEANGKEELTVDNGSDSEDDLQIVLNEEDCRMYPTLRDANVGNGRMMGGSDDEDDDLVIVTDANRPSKERKLSCDGLEHASACSGAEKGNGMKGSYLSQYSQYKYIRPHVAAFPIASKASGSGVAVPFSSPLSGKGDWDVNGCIQQMGSSSGSVASSSSIAIPIIAQRGYDFSLPRYRTIFDVNIEAFERKPWRQPGVDMTDFFNFGLDEESWKGYCNRLEQIRQQGTMLTKISESLRSNQAHGAESEHETVATEIGGGTRISLALRNADKGGRPLEMPKGRAIQVEGGIGERRPSMDVRRPRNRDSDVVIQIAVHESMGDSTSSDKQEQRHIDNSIQVVSDNGDSGMDNNRDMHHFGDVHEDAHSSESVDEYSRRYSASSSKDSGGCPLTRCSRPTAASNALILDPADSQGIEQFSDVDGHPLQKAKEHYSKDINVMEKIKHTKEGIDKNPSKAEPCTLEAESSLGDQIQCSLSPSSLDSHSKAYKVGVDIDSERTQKPQRRRSADSVTEFQRSMTSDYGNSKDSESDDSKTELGYCKYDSGDQSPNQEKQNCRRRMRFRSVAELKIHADDDVASSMADRKDWNGGELLKVRHGTWKKGRCDYGFYDGEDLSYYRETEISIGYHSGRLADKLVRNAYTEKSHRRVHRYFKDDMDPYHRRHWDGKDYFLGQRITAEDRKIKPREHYLPEREHTNEGINVLAYKESTRSLSGHSSHYTEKERYLWQRRKRHDEPQFRRRTEDDEFELERRCTEEFNQERYRKHGPYNSREEPFLEKYERHVPYIGRETKRPGRRERYCHSPCLDLDNSWSSVGHDDEHFRHFDHRSSSVDTCRESQFENERGWHDITSPRNDVCGSRRFGERDFDHWQQTQNEKHRDSWSDPRCKDEYLAEDRVIYPDDQVCNGRRRRSSWQSKVLHWDENKLSSRRQDRDDIYAEESPFSYERNTSQEHIRGKHEPMHRGMLLDDDCLEWDGNKMIREGSRRPDVSNHVSSSFDIIHRGRHGQAALRSRDSVDLHLVGWEGKGWPCRLQKMPSQVQYLKHVDENITLPWSSGRCSKTGNVRCNDGHDYMDRAVVKEQMVLRHSDGLQTRKMVPACTPKAESSHFHSISSKTRRVGLCDLEPSTDQSNEKWLDKYPVTQHHEASDLEEGQLAVEEPENTEVGAIEKNSVFESAARVGGIKEGRLKTEDAANKSKTVEVCDSRRILETIAKMERRRERFKDPIPLKELGKNPKPEPDHPIVETAEIKHQRPLRKRRWGGS